MTGCLPLTTHHSPLTRRRGFTLIELLVVIAIIAVLVGLTAAAVMRARHKGPELQNRHNISQLATSIQQYQSKYQVDFIPSRIVLREDGNYGAHATPAIAQAELQSLSYLKRLWPRLAVGVYGTTPGFAGHDWNGDGTITTGDAGSFVLEGDQCLVFFLGGIQNSGACLGFGTNKSYPANIHANFQVASPPIPATWSKPDVTLFDFPPSQLRIVGTASATRSAFFASFIDPYGTQPYLYFASRGGAGGVLNQYTAADCGSSAVTPYYHATSNVPFARDSFQIISAGYDKTFGPGGPFIPSQGITTPPGEDDMVNFHPGTLKFIQ